MQQKTLVIIKPDGVRRNIIGKLIASYEARGLRVMDIKMLQISEELAMSHYAEHIEKSFFIELLNYITSGKSVVIVLCGDNAVTQVRKINQELRKIYSINKTQNTVHGSDSEASAEREIGLFFQ